MSYLIKWCHLPNGTVYVKMFAGKTAARRGYCGQWTLRVAEWEPIRQHLAEAVHLDLQVLEAVPETM